MINYKLLLQWILNIQNRPLTQDLIDSGVDIVRQELKRSFDKKHKRARKIINKRYMSFLQNVYKNHEGLAAYKIKDVQEPFRRALEKRILNSLNLIKFKDEALLAAVEARFINFAIDDSIKDKTLKNLENNLKINEAKKTQRNYVKNILTDQTNRLNSDIDNIVATSNDAIGLIWNTREDNRVVGNPTGLYPKGNDMHNNHFERNKKFFILSSGWAHKKKLLSGEIYEQLEDVKTIGRAINCRCYMYYIYDLRDVPKENLSENGKRYIKKYN